MSRVEANRKSSSLVSPPSSRKLYRIKELESQQMTKSTASKNESKRFIEIFGPQEGNELLAKYLSWKEKAETELKQHDAESSLWIQCMKTALNMEPIEVETGPESSVFDPILVAPTDETGKPMRCGGGKPILYVHPARMNFDLYPPEIYTLCCLLFCYKSFNEEPATVLVDVRAGRGWPNMSVTRMYSWLRPCCAQISQLFPGALHKCLVFPVPFVAKALWYVVKPLLSERITESLVLVPGSGTSHSTPLPEKAMCVYIREEFLRTLEAERVASFGPPE